MPDEPPEKPPTKRPRAARPPAAGRAGGSAAEGAPNATPRIARRERRRERSREEIVEAARRVLFRDGLAATTLESVASEVGLTRAALYYYYPSKDALLFELLFAALETQACAIRDAVEVAPDGGAAIRAIITETMHHFAPRLDDFRLVFMHAQVAGPASVRVGPEEFARIRPLNDVVYAGATEKLAAQWQGGAPHADVDPRLMSFLANAAAIGVLTYKGMVESAGDPLRYTDEQLIEGLARIFEAAAGR